MSVSGLCGVCGTAEAVDRCESCGTFVCADHYDRSLGYCLECARQQRGGGQHMRD